MKNPRVEDFDPNARTRELGSPLDAMPRFEKPRRKAVEQTAPQGHPAVTQAGPAEKPAAAKSGNGVSKKDRQFIRRTFDIYDDQLAYLTKVSLEDRLSGGKESMNSMIRSAIDAFIEKHRKK
jgi:hypothetical protein